MLLLSPIVLLAAAALLAAIQLVRCLRSPLSKIPGPTISKFTTLFLKWKEIHAQRTTYVHQLHLQYGPVVRIAPNEVSFTSWEALKEIYCSGGSGYDKTEFYDLFTIYGRSSIDRLISHYVPTLYRLFSKVLYIFVKPRETPLADDYVLETSQISGPASFTLMSRFEEKSSDLDYIDKAAECLDHMAAGIDTTGDGLCFLLWELSQPRSLGFQRKLADELHRNPEAPLDRLPYLDAVINEGLRCFPPIPMSLPRYVPQGGRSIDNFWLPGQTIVSCQAYSVHRLNSDVFPDGDRFNPDRWMEQEGDADRRRTQFAFSNGGRGCVGKHLAIIEMKTLLRDIYSSYSTTPHKSMKVEDMAMSDQLISSRPQAQKCLLHFHPLDVINHQPGV
ncbi:hypothetical protein ACHAPX_009701 [Trichoderma viride]